MGAWDKFCIKEKLLKVGWKEIEEGGETYKLVPPQDLWDNRPVSFSVYDAEELQAILGPFDPEDE